jgi:hypothetical protein
MQVLYPHCCGVDVHKKNVVVCVLLTDLGSRTLMEQSTARCERSRP